MWRNERGNALITVLLMSLIFTILGLGIIGATIGGTKRVETRESDIHITYDSIKTIETLISDIAVELPNYPLEDYINNESNVNVQAYLNDFEDGLLLNTLEDVSNENIECINIIDLSKTPARYIKNDPTNACPDLNDYETINIDTEHDLIDTEHDLTRVLEFVLVTKNPNETEGDVTRTIKKRIILSPLPSFLKYAVGSSGELALNGSANIVGNIYANSLVLDNFAYYEDRNNKEEKIDSPMSSIIGDLYSSETSLLDIVKYEDNFYKKNIPALKHDSQFVNIKFDETFIDRKNEMIKKIDSTLSISEGSEFAKELAEGIRGEWSGSFQACPRDDEEDEENGSMHINTYTFQGDQNININDVECIIENSDMTKIGENVVIMNRLGGTISFNQDLVVNGDLYLISDGGNINLKENVYVTGNLYILNLKNSIQFNKDIVAANSILIESYSETGVNIGGEIVSGKNLTIKPHNTLIKFDNNIVVNNDFTIIGDDEIDEGTEENDEVIFDSVVYAGGNSSISNVNITREDKGSNDKFILMSGGDLILTRINEFKNFSNLKEDGSPPFLPKNDTNVKPLEGFFYTDKNATLYGVGSLFYINGGVFANGSLEINAVRGEVEGIEDLNDSLVQEDYYSRFIVEYDQDVLLQRIDALPIVEHYQLISDEFSIE